MSWVLEAVGGGVRYVDCIHGHVDDTTVTLNVDLTGGSPSPATVVKQVLSDNAGWRARLDLARLVAAGASEVGARVADRALEDARHRLRLARSGLEERVAWLRRGRTGHASGATAEGREEPAGLGARAPSVTPERVAAGAPMWA